MAHNKIIDSVKKHGQVAIKDLDEFLRFVINESDMRTYDDNYISILIPMKFDIDKVFGLDVCKRSDDDYVILYSCWYPNKDVFGRQFEILAAMTICDEKEENYLSVDLESRNEKFDTEALWCSLEAPNTLNPFVTGYLYSGNNETESDDWLLRIVDGYRAADDDSPRIVFANKRTVSVQDFCEESEGENKYKLFAATEKQFDQPFSYADFGTRLEEATHGYVKYDKRWCFWYGNACRER